MKHNTLMLATVGAMAAYWIIGLLIPTPYVSATASILVLICGVLALYRYAPTTYDVIINGKRNEDDASHLAVYGTALVALGSVYLGVFGILWIMAGQPEHWTGTAQSGFGRALAAAGFWLLFISPDLEAGRTSIPRMLWLVIIAFCALLVAFFLGTRFTPPERMLYQRTIDRPACPADRPIWVSSKGVLHIPESPYRPRVIPTRCFTSVDEAIKAGFRMPATGGGF